MEVPLVIDPRNIVAAHGLAAMQKGMLLSYALDPTSDAYVEQFDFILNGNVDSEAMRNALHSLSQEYATLRTVFSFRNTDDPYQVVLREWDPSLVVVDVRHESDSAAAVTRIKEEDRVRGFDLSRDVLLRATLIQVGDTAWHFVLCFHHIILDGWSLGPLFGALVRYYEQYRTQGTAVQEVEPQPYQEYVRWYEAQDADRAAAYFDDLLDDYEKPAVLPTQPTEGYERAVHRFTLPDGFGRRLAELSAREQVTMSALFQAAWGILLQKYTYSEDVVFGSVVSGRGIPLTGVEGMVGLFVNTLPLRVRCDGHAAFIEVARQVQESFRRASRFEHVPLFEIQQRTSLKNRLLNHVVAFENYPLSEKLRDFSSTSYDGLQFVAVDYLERTSYDLTVTVNPGERFEVTLSYNALAHGASLMADIEEGLVRILSAVCEQPTVLVSALALTSPPAAVVVAHPLPEVTVVDLFDKVVAAHSGAVALSWRGNTYTYAEVDAWSDAVAHQLVARGVQPGSGVGLLSERNPELIVGMLAAMKVGCHYIPIEIRESTARIKFILEDAGAPCLLTTAEVSKRVPEGTPVLVVERPTSPSAPFKRIPLSTDTPAYMMYTSGSTGRPKGCYITHRNIVRLFTDQSFYDFDAAETMMLTSSPAFDVCTFEIWGALLFGARLVLPDEIDFLDVARLRTILAEQEVRGMWLTAPLFNQLVDADPGAFAPLHHLLIGGSALSVKHVAKVVEACPGIEVTNGYGPTENTTFSTAHHLRPADLLRDRIPIGLPLAHSTGYALDRGLQPLPRGAAGELCVGGAGVSPGYHRRPDLDAERFVEPEWLGLGRLYRTGDLVRQLPDGTFDYLGRVDDQVKVRGFRVEIGEVELAIEGIAGVKDVAVVAAERREAKTLVAFVVPIGDLTADEVRSELQRRLASYMVPTSILMMDALPLNRSGKVDRRALVAMYLDREPHRVSRSDRHLSPTERVVTEIVEDVLGEYLVNTQSNFFDIGVNSLALLAINNRLRQAGWDIPLKTLFEHTTIAALSAHLDRGAPAEPAEVLSADEEAAEKYALDASQRMLQLMDEGDHCVS